MKNKIFRCDCGGHLVEFSYEDEDFSSLSICIYNKYNKKANKKLKEPKLMADVVILNNNYENELTELLKFLHSLPKEIKNG